MVVPETQVTASVDTLYSEIFYYSFSICGHQCFVDYLSLQKLYGAH